MPFYDFFPHNWATEVAMATVWTTQVDVSENRLAETRRNLVDAPRRTITVRWSGLRQSIATRLLFEIMRSADSQRRIPLYQDVSVTTASSSSQSGWVTSCGRTSGWSGPAIALRRPTQTNGFPSAAR